ncbi:hypothetical protein [Paraburkholderia bannensis]|nr:hypothetical protein [Paraburkholderia bannensis]
MSKRFDTPPEAGEGFRYWRTLAASTTGLLKIDDRPQRPKPVHG